MAGSILLPGPGPIRHLEEGYIIHCSQDLADIWHTNKRDLNFSTRTDEEFLLFLIYQTVQSLSNSFSDTLLLPASHQPVPQPAPPLLPPPPTVGRPPSHHPAHLHKTSCPSVEGYYECLKCKKSFRNKTYLNRHEKRSCGVNPLKIYHCQYCVAVMTSAAGLNVHMKQQHRDVRYSCDQCNKKFKNAEYVKHHVRVEHNKMKDYKCTQCGKDFTQRGTLRVHMKMVHQKLRNYICRICSRPFGCKSHLTRHIRKIHRDVKEVICEICSELFQHSHDLETHIKQNHYQTELICNTCNKVFRLKHMLAKHIVKCHGSSPNSVSQTDVGDTTTTTVTYPPTAAVQQNITLSAT